MKAIQERAQIWCQSWTLPVRRWEKPQLNTLKSLRGVYVMILMGGELMRASQCEGLTCF